MESKLGLGMLLVAAIAIIVGITLLETASNNVTGVVTEVSGVNVSATMGAVTVPVAVTGYQGIDGSYTVVFQNATAANVTVASASSNGQKILYATPNDAGAATRVVKITGTLQPTGYIDDPAGRSIAGLIVIFGALAIAVVGLYPVVKEHLLG